MFGQLMHGIAQDFVRYVMHVQVVQPRSRPPRRPCWTSPPTRPRTRRPRPCRPRRSRRWPTASCRRGRRRGAPSPPAAGGGRGREAGRPQHEAADGRERRVGEDGAQRALPVRVGQEVQALPRALTRAGLHRRPARAPGAGGRGAPVPADRRRPGPARRARGRGRRARPLGRPGPRQAAHRRVRRGQGRPRHLRRAGRARWTTPRSSTSWPGRRATRARSPRSRPTADELAGKLDRLELRSLFTGEHDEADAICRINAKDGGVDAQDWAEMLLRMYSAGPSAAASTSTSTTSPRAPRPASSRPSSPSRGATPTA